MSARIPYESYLEHSMHLNAEDERLQAELLPQIPELVIDSHVHSADHAHYDPANMSERVRAHMMSTFPVTTLEMSQEIDDTLMPGKTVRKVRFAHAYAGIDHFGVNDYLFEHSPSDDAVAVFGRNGSQEEIDQTIKYIEDPRASGLKMYYLSTGEPLSDVYDYFPPAILEAAQDRQVPIILHLPHSLYKSHEEVHGLAKAYPKLDIILAHLGVAHVPREGLDEILASFAPFDNIFADTSQVHDSRLIAAALRHMGADKLLYGSDEPLNLLRTVVYDNPALGPRLLTDYPYHWVDPAEYEAFIGKINARFVQSEWQQLEAIVQGIGSVGLSAKEAEEAKHKIFHENATRVFKLDE